MDYNEAAKMLVEKGFYYSDIKAWSSSEITDTFKQFLQRSDDEKMEFLQKEINSVFDGYSYQGQADSLNQGPEDLVHTFVISEFTDHTRFSIEWRNYLATQFKALSSLLQTIESSLIPLLFEQVSRRQFGHMVSCNYYPKQNIDRKTKRLSAHPDVSLFTIFPFGIDDQLEYEENGVWKSMPPSTNMVMINGYFAEVISDGKVIALNHRVKQAEDNLNDRFSYAFFCIPAPEQQYFIGNSTIATEAYFQKYLGLF